MKVARRIDTAEGEAVSEGQTPGALRMFRAVPTNLGSHARGR
jgi:hypothetical protein